MHYIRRGSGETVFLLHGFCSSSVAWGESFEALAQCFDVVAPDWPGFGQSGNTAPCKTIHDFANELIALADKLSISCFGVVGHSIGSFVAQELMLEHGSRVNASVLYGAGLRMDGAARFESAEQTIDFLRQHGPEATVKRVAATWFVQGERHPNYARCLEAGRGMTTNAGIAAIEAARGVDFTASLPTATAPTLVIAGDQERTFPPRMALELATTAAHGRLCILPDCGHAAHLEQPDTFNTIVRDYLLRRRRACTAADVAG